MIIISPYDPTWPAQFRDIAQHLRATFADSALRIDHIGSTSVPDLDAKDIIDIQVTVVELEDLPFDALAAAGYTVRDHSYRDDFVEITDISSPELCKRYMHEVEGQRRCNIHIRQAGRFNQRFPLLFRDYLRASTVSRRSYEIIKYRLAALFPESIDGYLSIKDPLMDMLYEAATHWAAQVDWQPDIDFI